MGGAAHRLGRGVWTTCCRGGRYRRSRSMPVRRRASDPRWHERGHGTAFRTRWGDDLTTRSPRSCSSVGPTARAGRIVIIDTIIVGRDAEIVFQRPPSVAAARSGCSSSRADRDVLAARRHAFGRIDADAAEFVPVKRAPQDRVGRVRRSRSSPCRDLQRGHGRHRRSCSSEGRRSTAWSTASFITQHAGLRENVVDSRDSTRTVTVLVCPGICMDDHAPAPPLPSVLDLALPSCTPRSSQLVLPLPNQVRHLTGSVPRSSQQHR